VPAGTFLGACPIICLLLAHSGSISPQQGFSVRTRIFQIDAFTARRFAGNCAAVLPMPPFHEAAVLRAIAADGQFEGEAEY
jgi:hypothetical protein